MRLAPKHLAFSSKTQGYLQQNAELKPMFCAVKGRKCPPNTKKTARKVLYNTFLVFNSDNPNIYAQSE